MQNEARKQAYLYASKANIPITGLANDAHQNWMEFVANFHRGSVNNAKYLCPSKHLLKKTGEEECNKLKKIINCVGSQLADRGLLSIQSDHWSGTALTRKTKLNFHGIILGLTRLDGSIQPYLLRFSYATRKDDQSVKAEINETMKVSCMKQLFIEFFHIGYMYVISRVVQAEK